MDPNKSASFSDRFEYQPGQNDLYKTLNELQKSGEDWIDLTLSNPTKAKIIYPSEAILHSLSNSLGMDYDPNPKGILSAREAVSGYYLQKGISYSPEDLFLTASSSEAYSFLIKLLCNPKEEVLIPSPGYPLFEFLSLLEGVKFNTYRLDPEKNWGIDFEDLESKLSKKTKIVFVVSPNNPTGSIISKNEFEKLKELGTAKKFSIVLDEVFGDYLYGSESTSLQIENSTAPIFTVNGISKILALPQMKLSWIHIQAPDDWKEECKERLEIIADTYLSLATPIQLALPELLHWRKMIQSQVQRRIQRNLQILEEVFGNTDHIRYKLPAGGWYSILQSKSFLDDQEMCLKLLKKEKVLVHPGSMFGLDADAGYFVLSLLPENDLFQEGLTRVLCFSQ